MFKVARIRFKHKWYVYFSISFVDEMTVTAVRSVGQVSPTYFLYPKRQESGSFFVFVSNLVNCFGDVLRNFGSSFDSFKSSFKSLSLFCL